MQLNYNKLNEITLTFVDLGSSMVEAVVACNEYKIDNEYLSNNVSEFHVYDNNIYFYKEGRQSLDNEIIIPKNGRPSVKKGDYVYASKYDGANVISPRVSALYVGIVDSIDYESRTIYSKSILTLLDTDSVISHQGMFPYYNWANRTGHGGTSDDRYALMDCNTILALIQSIEMALGQTPKILARWDASIYNAYSPETKKQFLYPKVWLEEWPINWTASNGYNNPLAGPMPGVDGFDTSYPRERMAQNDSPWWSNGHKKDILIDCPEEYFGIGMGDSSYVFNILSWTNYFQEPFEYIGGTYHQSKRYNMDTADFPSGYGSLGPNSKAISVESLWSRLKQWYEKKHVMVLPVVYDSASMWYANPTGIDDSSNWHNQTAGTGSRSVKYNYSTGELKLQSVAYNSQFSSRYLSPSLPYIYTWYPTGNNPSSEINYATAPRTNGDYLDSQKGICFVRPYENGHFLTPRPYPVDRCDLVESLYPTSVGSGRTVFCNKGLSEGFNTYLKRYAYIGLKIVWLDAELGYSNCDEYFNFPYNSNTAKDELYAFAPRDPLWNAEKADTSSSPWSTTRAKAHCTLPREEHYGLPSATTTTYNCPYSFFYRYKHHHRTDYDDGYAYRENYMREGSMCAPTQDQRWHFVIREDDSMVNSVKVTEKGTDTEKHDIVLYKDTIGAIAADYKQDRKKEWTFNDYALRPIGAAAGNPYINAQPEDDAYPVAIYNADTGTTAAMAGGFDENNGVNGYYWGGGSARDRVSQGTYVSNSVVPVVMSRDSLRATGRDNISEACIAGLPTNDADVNIEIEIKNDKTHRDINKWQVRFGQKATVIMNSGKVYDNLRVLGVNMNSDDDFFTVSVGANSPTIINEIERRTR